MTNRYTKYAQETAARISELQCRVKRFSSHPTLHTRVPGVKNEIAELESQLHNLFATGRWADELYGGNG